MDPTNFGFGKACSRGSARGHGASVVFLNPHAEVTPGGMPAALAAFRTRPEAGIAGAWLVDDDAAPSPTGLRP